MLDGVLLDLRVLVLHVLGEDHYITHFIIFDLLQVIRFEEDFLGFCLESVGEPFADGADTGLSLFQVVSVGL